jgi:hypothetical protein
MWFIKEKKIDFLGYENVYKRLIEIEQRVNGLEIENKFLRDKVLRKIQKLPNTEEDDLEPSKAKSLKPFNPFM